MLLACCHLGMRGTAFMMTGVDGAALGSASRVLAVVPMFHANSWGLVFAAPLVGACLVLPGALRLGRVAAQG